MADDTTFDLYYARLADKAERGPHYYGGAQVAALRCMRGYHVDARYTQVDGYGVTRYMTQKQARVYAILHRNAYSGSPRLTMTAIAAEVHACASTVSRAIQRFQQWGMFGVEITRGKYGGIKVFLADAGDRFVQLVDRAKEKARERWRRLRKSNVASSLPREVGSEQEQVEVPITYGRNIRMGTFAEAVYAERARLAIIDPEGEKEAVAPLDYGRAFYILANGAESEHQAEQRRQDIDAERAIAEARFWFKANGA